MNFGIKELLFVASASLSQTACVGDNSSNASIQDFKITKTCDSRITSERSNMDVKERVLDILRTCDAKVLEVAQGGYCGIPVENIVSGNLNQLDIDKACFYLDPLTSQNLYSGQIIDEPILFQNIFEQLRILEKQSPEIASQIKNSNWTKVIIDEYQTGADRPLYLYKDILQTLGQLSPSQKLTLKKNPKWNQFLHRFDEVLREGDIQGNLVMFLIDNEVSYASQIKDELYFILSSKNPTDGFLASESINM